MSNYGISNPSSTQPDFFQINGTAVTGTFDGNPEGAAAQGLGTADVDIFQNVQLGGECTGEMGSNINVADGSNDGYQHQINTGVSLPNRFTADEVFYKGNLDNLTGGMLIGPECRHEFTGHYSPGVDRAIALGYWNPVTASWTCGDPTGVLHQFAADEVLTENIIVYQFGSTEPTGQAYDV